MNDKERHLHSCPSSSLYLFMNIRLFAKHVYYGMRANGGRYTGREEEQKKAELYASKWRVKIIISHTRTWLTESKKKRSKNTHTHTQNPYSNSKEWELYVCFGNLEHFSFFFFSELLYVHQRKQFVSIFFHTVLFPLFLRQCETYQQKSKIQFEQHTHSHRKSE